MDAKGRATGDTLATSPGRMVEMAVGRELEQVARALERDLAVSPEDADDTLLEALTRTLEREEPLERYKMGPFVSRTSRN